MTNARQASPIPAAAAGRPVDPRLHAVVDRILGDLHAAVRDLEVTEPELRAALAFLTEVGTAGEWQLFSDVLGISVAVDANTHQPREGATASNVEGPFYRPGAPLVTAPVSLCGDDEPGEVLFMSGQVRSAGGEPLPGALLDVWQTNESGLYEHEDPAQPEWNLRRRFHAGDGGRYEFRTVAPAAYQIPHSGPVGRFLAAVGRHPWRPAHLHVKVCAAGHQPLTTMLYLEGDAWLDDDTIFSVKPELVVAMRRHDQPEDLAARGLDRPFSTAGYDFSLEPSG
jgi:catechol 1,2-dioxygenase